MWACMWERDYVCPFVEAMVCIDRKKSRITWYLGCGKLSWDIGRLILIMGGAILQAEGPRLYNNENTGTHSPLPASQCVTTWPAASGSHAWLFHRDGLNPDLRARVNTFSLKSLLQGYFIIAIRKETNEHIYIYKHVINICIILINSVIVHSSIYSLLLEIKYSL